jgi:hypothetical protein
VNSKKEKVSKALAVTGLLCLPGLLAPEVFGSATPATLPSAIAGDACGAEQKDLRFRMLRPGEEPDLRAARGLQVCLAVYHSTADARR